jgi:hypothetical protein
LDKAIEKRVKNVSIAFIVISLILILFNAGSLIYLYNNDVIQLFHDFNIDVSYYVNEQTIYHIVNFVFYFALLTTSILTYKLNNSGRIGFNLILVLSIIYFFIAPLIFNSELPYPQTSPEGNISMDLIPGTNSDMSINLLTYAIAIIKSAVLVFVIFFFSRNKVVELFKTI